MESTEWRCPHECEDLREDSVKSTGDMQSFMNRALGMPMFVDEVGGPWVADHHKAPLQLQ
jgi:hypothetical protein